MAKCASCTARKGKRNCPALGSLICLQCCGTKRQKKIDCPSDCFFLGKSEQYFTDRQESAKLSGFEREMKSIIGNEEAHEDMLQNIEFVLHRIYRDHGAITDRHIETALEYLMEMGKAQLDLPAKFLTELPYNVQSIVTAVNDVIEFRESFAKKESLTTRLKCIYRVLHSVRTHHNFRDDCSYLKFIGNFLL
ncbi:MAG: hypothetical protein ABSG91_01840 [Syntrophobacteraceae bacterium]